jgi:formylglycine-generating enzyme required for sulfatase activity
MTEPTPKQLHQFILDCFNDDDLDLFCLEYFGNALHSFGSGMSRTKKALELIGYCQRRDMMNSLLTALMQEREEVYRRTFVDRFVDKKTGLEFVRIPAGEFLYGDEKKRIYLPEYWISKTPVTQAVYQRFITANAKDDVPFVDADWAKPYNWDVKRRTHPVDKADHPIVIVSWWDAVVFCEWAGFRLPTEEQWEKAARGTDGRSYPWGNNEPTNKLCNFNQNEGGTTSDGRYSPHGDSPYGCLDMSGNVWEWCVNKYDNPADMTIDQSNARRVVRGGSWDDDQLYARAADRSRYHPVYRLYNLCFRVVRRSPSP